MISTSVFIFQKVIFTLIGTIVFPFLLSGVSLAFRSPDLMFGQRVFNNWMMRAGYKILAFVMTPFQLAIMHTKYYFLSLELKVLHSKASALTGLDFALLSMLPWQP